MIEELQGFKLDDIEKAFRKWVRENEKIPTPASILKLLNEPNYDGKKLMDFGGDYSAYKEYLNKRSN